MANPLILPSTRKDLMAQIGRKSREANRQKEDEKILHAALLIYQKHLPEMLQDPPDAHQFESKWPVIDQELQKELKSERAYRRAYSFICSQLERGNCAGIWSVDIPAPFITLRRNRPVRTERWQQQSRSCAEAEMIWTEQQNIMEKEPDRLFAKLLLSMVFYGGLNRPDLWPALAQALTQTRPLRGNTDLCWIPLNLPAAKSRPSNTYAPDNLGNKKAISSVSYMPDPISLGLLRQFLECCPANWIPPKTEKACLALLCDELGQRSSSTQIAHGGITIAEHQPGLRLPQVLVEFAIGRLPSASLPEPYWQRLMDPAVQSCRVDNYEMFQVIDFNTRSRIRRNKNQNSSLLAARLRETFKKDPARPIGKSQLVTRLENLMDPELPTNQRIIMDWLLDHLTIRNNAISTTKTYLENIGNAWLSATDEICTDEYTGEDFYDLYQSILNRPISQQAREYQAGRLEDLHGFAVLRYDFPPLPTPLIESSTAIPHVSAAIVDEDLFRALIRQIAQFSDLDEYSRRMLQCFLVMAYRTGLRPGELAKLRLMDIESSPIAWLFIRNNRHGHNKTEAALRKVPLFPLLTDTELPLVQAYLRERRIHAHSDTELFFHAAGNMHELLDTQSLGRAVKTILADLSGGLKYRLYHLRHSALSRMQLLLHHDQVTYPEFVDKQLPYGAELRQKLLELIAGRSRLRDRYAALAAMAGHSSPEITFGSYLHYTDLLLGLHLAQNHRLLSPALAHSFLGLRHHRIQKTMRAGKRITPAETAQFLRKRLIGYLQVAARHRQPAPQPQQLTHSRPSSYLAMLAVLGKIEAGQDHREIAWFYQLDENQIQNWQESAEALRDLLTEKETPRLFPKSRRHQLLPPEPVDIDEKHDIETALTKIRDLFSQPERRRDIKFFICYLLTHCNSSRAGIRFNSPYYLKQFMDIAQQIFPWKKWQLHVQLPRGRDDSDWNCHHKLMTRTSTLKKSGHYPYGLGFLFLRHRNEKKKNKSNLFAQYSSSSLRTVAHRLAILLFDHTEILAWRNKQLQERASKVHNHYLNNKRKFSVESHDDTLMHLASLTDNLATQEMILSRYQQFNEDDSDIGSDIEDPDWMPEDNKYLDYLTW